jgi:hypothetical protein
MKIWSSEHVFHHSWENVVKAALQKYPNPLNPSVFGVDVIERHIDFNENIIKSHRLLATTWQMAPWITKLLGGNKTCYASEHSRIDLSRRQFELRSRNLTFNNIINVEEKLTYQVHPNDEKKTLLTQEAEITVRNVPLIDYMENLLATKINANAHKGRLAIEFVIQKMNTITDDAADTVKRTFTETERL